MTDRFRRRSALLVAAVLLALAGAGCSGGDDGGDGAGGKAGTKPTAASAKAPAPVFGFNVTAADVRSPTLAPPFPEELKAAVKASIDTYLVNGVVTPLQTGKPPGGLEGIFTGAAGGRIVPGHPDRAALLEEGQPVSGKVTQDRAETKLTALLDGSGAPSVVTALVDFALTVKGKGTTLGVVRTGELVLVYDNNAWRIDAFQLRTARDTR